MSFLTEWVTNIIVLVLLAGVIELLLPGNQFQSYIKMVIGLLILLAMLSPIFKILHTNFDQVFKGMDLPAVAKESEIKNSIEINKSEIQDTQRAYILKQMAVPLKEQVQEELKKTYGVEIVDLQIQTERNREPLKPEDISGAEVVLAHYKKQEGISEVSEVNVSISNSKKRQQETVPDEIVQFLGKEWELETKHIVVKMEGGEESSQ
ncbi:stage III sporulation protein AF [Fictibacillus barbaricus]|uniref:Stage III sporulation protein AF n=1 Tax=Fictibacillus barbaricus TaxID=182136 RepID=A0ABU1TZT8_9BACL|nr:stage III sporulation protein AF [Fictibacillus barbaricus]MDR7072688.1 stage III sporulation protein AF [Fictibacillus barbaricus]